MNHKYSYFMPNLLQIEKDIKALRKYYELRPNEELHISISNENMFTNIENSLNEINYHSYDCSCNEK